MPDQPTPPDQLTLIGSPALPGTQKQATPMVLKVAPAPNSGGTTPGGINPGGTLPPPVVIPPPVVTMGLIVDYPRIGGHTPAQKIVTYSNGYKPVGAAPLAAAGGTVTGQSVSQSMDGNWRVAFTPAPAFYYLKMTVWDVLAGPNASVDLYPTFAQDFAGPPSLSTQFRGFRFTLPSAPPSDFPPPRGNVFQFPQAPAMQIDNSDGKLVSYEVREWRTGRTVSTGPVPGSYPVVAYAPPPGGFPFGAYQVFVYGAVSLFGYGTVVSDTFFIVAPNDLSTGLFQPGDPAYLGGPNGNHPDTNAYASAYMAGAGCARLDVQDAANPDIPALVNFVNSQKLTYGSYRDGTPRPGCVTVVNWPNLRPEVPGQLAGVTAVARALTPLGVTWYAPTNEPGGCPSDVLYAGVIRQFAQAVRAGDPAAKVLAFESVFPYTPGMEAILDALGPGVIDGFSMHTYDAVGTVSNGLRVMGQMRGMLERTGYGAVPVFMTEQGVYPASYGVQHPRVAIQQFATHMMVMDRMGLPPANVLYWSTQGGFNEHQTGISLVNESFTPPALWYRRRAVEALEVNFVSGYDFGAGGNSVWFGNRFDGFGKMAGLAVSIFYGMGTHGSVLRLSVSGANVPASLVYADANGNETVMPVTSGVVTTPPNVDGNLFYIRHATGLTLTPTGTNYGPNIALNAAVVTLASPAEASKLTDGIIRGGGDPYWEPNLEVPWASDSLVSISPYGQCHGDTPLPCTIEVNLGGVKTLSRVIVRLPPAVQNFGGLIDAAIETSRDGITWTPFGHISQPANTLEIYSNRGTYATHATDYWAGAYTFNVASASPVQADHFRLVVKDCTQGGMGDAVAAGFGGQPSIDATQTGTVKTFSISQIEGYSA